MLTFDALTVAGIAAAVVAALFIIKTCIDEGCSRGC